MSSTYTPGVNLPATFEQQNEVLEVFRHFRSVDPEAVYELAMELSDPDLQNAALHAAMIINPLLGFPSIKPVDQKEYACSATVHFEFLKLNLAEQHDLLRRASRVINVWANRLGRSVQARVHQTPEPSSSDDTVEICS